MCWSSETRYPKIAELISNNRYKTLCRYIHVVDKTQKEKEENKNDKIFKIYPVLDMVQKNCRKIEPEPMHPIDEQIVPAETKYSGSKNFKKEQKKLYGPFLWMGFNCLKARAMEPPSGFEHGTPELEIQHLNH